MRIPWQIGKGIAMAGIAYMIAQGWAHGISVGGFEFILGMWILFGDWKH